MVYFKWRLSNSRHFVPSENYWTQSLGHSHPYNQPFEVLHRVNHIRNYVVKGLYVGRRGGQQRHNGTTKASASHLHVTMNWAYDPIRAEVD